jgi:transposase
MMGTQAAAERLFYDFCLNEHVPHILRQIDRCLDLSGVRRELKPFYSHIGRPSIDPELMIRMLIVGYCFAIRSERRLCEEVHLNLAYRWFCRLGLEAKFPITPPSRSTAMAAFGKATFCVTCSRPWCAAAWPKVWWVAKDLPSMRA